MEDQLRELPLREVVERLGSSDPVPGGGSAAALAGAMGAALVTMVVELTRGRDSSDEAALVEIATASASWQSEMLNLAELDANAYAAVVTARRMPRDTEADRLARDVQLAAALREATRVPLETVRAAREVLALTERVARVGAARAISDVGVAALLATASARSAALSVRINLPHVDDELREDSAATLAELLRGLEDRERAVSTLVEDRMG